jgi:hypothetical protein
MMKMRKFMHYGRSDGIEIDGHWKVGDILIAMTTKITAYFRGTKLLFSA